MGGERRGRGGKGASIIRCICVGDREGASSDGFGKGYKAMVTSTDTYPCSQHTTELDYICNYTRSQSKEKQQLEVQLETGPSIDKHRYLCRDVWGAVCKK